MTVHIQFFLSCIPPKATSQQKRCVVVGGKPRFFKKKSVEQAQESVGTMMLPHKPGKPIEGPVALTVVMTWPWRKTEPKRNRARGWMWMPTRPDIDNLVKAQVMDTMTDLGFWLDDSQVVHLTASKRWGDTPGISIELISLSPGPDPAGEGQGMHGATVFRQSDLFPR